MRVSVVVRYRVRNSQPKIAFFFWTIIELMRVNVRCLLHAHGCTMWMACSICSYEQMHLWFSIDKNWRKTKKQQKKLNYIRNLNVRRESNISFILLNDFPRGISFKLLWCGETSFLDAIIPSSCMRIKLILNLNDRLKMRKKQFSGWKVNENIFDVLVTVWRYASGVLKYGSIWQKWASSQYHSDEFLKLYFP